jgi:hypothetical protein
MWVTGMKNTPAPGWVVRLDIPEASRAGWEHQLQPPFEPYIERIGEGDAAARVLRSELFDGRSDAEEVWGRALPLVEQLNGAQRISQEMQPVQCNGVGRVDSDGKLSIIQFATAQFKGNAIALAFAEQRDAQGNLIISPPRSSEMQRWVQAAQVNDDIADLLGYLASADNWYDVYKAFEVVEAMVDHPRQHNLRQLLGPDAKRYDVAHESANFYRHARKKRPPNLISLEEARSRLVHVVRTIAVRFLGSE